MFSKSFRTVRLVDVISLLHTWRIAQSSFLGLLWVVELKFLVPRTICSEYYQHQLIVLWAVFRISITWSVTRPNDPTLHKVWPRSWGTRHAFYHLECNFRR